MAIVYIHINKINNKKYVGISSSSDVNRRWGREGEGYKNSKFYNLGILQYGWDNFKHIILVDQINLSLAEQIEARLIKILNLKDESCGYNESSGVNIQESLEYDVMANNLIKRIEKEEKPFFSITSISTGYIHTTNKYLIEFIYESLYKKDRINTELDCQRGYVWTEERKQGMWDTLLRGHRIPEIHVIRKGMEYEVIDGKQRLTTIMKILDDEIPFSKVSANKELQPLFDITQKSKILFSELPEDFKERIYNTSLTFAEYSDISDDELITLFRKLNASHELSDFSKGIANNINIRTNFTRYLIGHPSLRKLFTENGINNSDDEKMLIRLACLLKYGVGQVDLMPNKLDKLYKDFTSAELNFLREQIEKILDLINEKSEKLSKFRQKDSFLPIILFIICEKGLSKTQITELFDKVTRVPLYVKGENFDKRTTVQRYKTILELI